VAIIGNDIVVTYVLDPPGQQLPTAGPGFGYVDIFSSTGQLLQSLEHGSWLNVPWGLALAPLDFGRFSHDLAKQAGGLLVWAGAEVQLRQRCMLGIEIARADISRRKRPDALDRERLAVTILQQSVELARRHIVGGNEAGGLGVSCIRKLSDQPI
jgi:hypothetical protein